MDGEKPEGHERRNNEALRVAYVCAPEWQCAYACVSDVSEWVDERGERAVARVSSEEANESGRIKYPSCQ